MPDNLNFANTNSLWGSFLAESLFRVGVRHAVVSPGSRSAPLIHALATHPAIRAVPVLDERSAAFFALGIAKKVKGPVVLVCTSGTAAANFFPAVIEARESRVPLLVLTADRPPEMRDCASGQTIDQLKIFGHYPRWQAEVSLPEPSEKFLAYLRQTVRHACERTLWPVAGPVHLNLPFRDPLAPVEDASLAALDRARAGRLLEGLLPVEASESRPSANEARRLAESIERAERPILVAGPANAKDPVAYVEAVEQLAGRRAIPVLADALSPVRQRGGAFPYLVSNYDFLIGRGELARERPDFVLRLGALPTSKRLRSWLEGLDCLQWVVEEGDQNVDPLHGRCIHVRASLPALAAAISGAGGPVGSSSRPGGGRSRWVEASLRLREEMAKTLEGMEEIFEGKIAWLLSQYVPAGAAVFISNSTPVRDAEYFWQPGKEPVELFFNRGANGIDGIVSTAMGLASVAEQTILLTGDLAFLHDQNGLLNAKAVRGGLTIVLINNGGGGIFRALPVAEFDPPFHEFFLTPQQVDFSALCAGYEIRHEVIAEWKPFIEAIKRPWRKGLRVLEVRTNPEADWQLRSRLLKGAMTS